MKKIEKRDLQTIRFLKWVRKHLEQERLYEVIFVLLMVHGKEKYVKDIPSFMLLDMVIENWSGKRRDRSAI